MNNRKDANRINIRKNAGLPDDNGKIAGLVSEDPYEICENTIGYAPLYARRTQNNDTVKEFRQNQTAREQHGMIKPKFFEASGGATSPNTEVNADGQGIASEVPRKTAK